MSENWCEGCKQEHGPLYICPSFSEEKKALKQAQGDKLRQNLKDPKWVEAQNLEEHELAIFKLFAGIE